MRLAAPRGGEGGWCLGIGRAAAGASEVTHRTVADRTVRRPWRAPMAHPGAFLKRSARIGNPRPVPRTNASRTAESLPAAVTAVRPLAEAATRIPPAAGTCPSDSCSGGHGSRAHDPHRSRLNGERSLPAESLATASKQLRCLTSCFDGLTGGGTCEHDRPPPMVSCDRQRCAPRCRALPQLNRRSRGRMTHMIARCPADGLKK